ncbi:MAG: hypothetical protein HZA01_17100 [Nitrospinae bacterium]|nr:hypothetical protein [Nitrospinota bacterium]
MEIKNPYIKIFQDLQAKNIKYLVVGELGLTKDFDQLYSRGLKQEAGKNSLYFIGKEYLIDMKAKAGNAVWLDKIKEKFAGEKE